MPAQTGQGYSAETVELAAALTEALELAAEGWAYAGDYFVEKWEFVARYNKLAEVAGLPQITGDR